MAPFNGVIDHLNDQKPENGRSNLKDKFLY